MNIVEMKGITKQFGPVLANQKVDFELKKGEVHALLGENGAGKTTLMRILYGLYKADEGEIFIKDQNVKIGSPKDAIEHGIGMVTQHFALVPPFSVAENVIMGSLDKVHVDMNVYEKKVAQAAEKFGIDINPAAIVRHLSVGQKQRVEILKALYREAQVLILDEPTAVLVPQEVEALFETLKRLTNEGISIVFISHKLNEVMQICNRVTVLRDGAAINTVDVAGITTKELARMMVGRETFGVSRSGEHLEDNPVLRLKGLSAEDDQGIKVLKNIDLKVNAGEVLGLAGVGGNGQTELAEVLSGTRKPSAGQIFLKDKPMTGASPAEFTAAGVGRIPEDRHAGIVGELTVAENLVLDQIQNFSTNAVLDRKQIRENANQLIERFQIKARPTDKARTLSGGNMQKMLLARVLAEKPLVIIAPQPTRGLDVGATEYVHQQLLDQREQGAGVLLISEDLDEILALSDRVAVIYEGEIVGVMPIHEADVERLGLLMSGAVKEENNAEN